MSKMRNRYWIGSLLWLLSLILLIWTEWPIRSEIREIVFQPGELQVMVPLPDGSGQAAITGDLGIPLAFHDVRKVTLEWIPIIRKGEPSIIKLNFTGNNPPLLDNSSINSETLENSPTFENLFHVFTVDAEARVGLSGVNVEPAGISGKVLREDQTIEFIWEIIPNDAGLYNGVAWLYLRYFPKLEGDLIEQAVSAQSFDLKVVSFLGINSNYWRVISVLGIIIGIYYHKKRIIRFISIAYGKITYKISKFERKSIK